MTASQTSRRVFVMVALVGLAVAAFIAFRIYVEGDRDITAFVAFGTTDPGPSEYGMEKLGEIHEREGLGHDGRFFFIQANDPLLLDPDDNAIYLDRPGYRSQRMFYPLLAGGLGFFPAASIPWAMLVVNLLAMVAGTWATAVIAVEMGGSPWWGLAFALNIGLISEMSIGAAGVVAAAAGFGAVALILRNHFAMGVGLLVVASLSREAMLIMAAGAAFWLWRRGRPKDSVIAVVVPLAAVGMWALYVRARLGGDSGVAEIQEIGWPFVGLIEAFGSWLSEPINLAMGMLLVLIFVAFVRRVLISDSLVGWSTVGFVGLALLLTEQVWHDYFDITRAIAPVLTAFVLLVALGKDVREEQRDPERFEVDT